MNTVLTYHCVYNCEILHVVSTLWDSALCFKGTGISGGEIHQSQPYPSLYGWILKGWKSYKINILSSLIYMPLGRLPFLSKVKHPNFFSDWISWNSILQLWSSPCSESFFWGRRFSMLKVCHIPELLCHFKCRFVTDAICPKSEIVMTLVSLMVSDLFDHQVVLTFVAGTFRLA